MMPALAQQRQIQLRWYLSPQAFMQLYKPIVELEFNIAQLGASMPAV